MSLSVDNLIRVEPTSSIIAPSFSVNTDGTTSAPAFSRSGSSLGMFFGTNQINFSVNNSNRFNISTTKTTSTLPIVVPISTSSNCSLQASGAANTGITFSPTQYFLVAAGTTTQSSTSAFITYGVPTKAVNGSSVSCSYQFSSEAGMGLYYVSTNVMGLCTGGYKILELSNSGLSFALNGVSGYVPTALNYYEENNYTTTFGFVGFNQTTNISCKIVRIGNRVTLYVPDWNQTVQNNSGGNALCVNPAGTRIDTRFRPTNGCSTICSGYLNGNANLIWVYVSSSGSINIYKGVGVGNATWANGDTCQLDGFSLSWSV